MRSSCATSGPEATTSSGCSASSEPPSLDALVDEVVPPSIRTTAPADPAGRPVRARVPPGPQQDRGQEPRPQVLHRARLLRHDHAAGHPAQRDRESRLVHALHAIPGRDRPGAAGVAAQLPDDGQRSDRDGGRQRVAARRADGGGRGDDAAASRAAEARRRSQYVPGVVAHLAADPRRHRIARRAARHRGARSSIRRTSQFDETCSGCWCSIRTSEAAVEPLAPLIARAHDAGVLVAVATDLLALTAPDASRRSRRRRRRRQLAAFRRAARLRRTARGLFRDARDAYVRQVPGPHHRRLGGQQRPARLPHGAADARAAHPPREGDVEHLHGAGAARQHGRDVRGLPRTLGAPAIATQSQIARGVAREGADERSGTVN